MKYLALFFLLISFTQCSDDFDDFVEIEVKLVGEGNIEKSVFEEDEPYRFMVKITNLSVDQNITWYLPDGDWNQFKLFQNGRIEYDWLSGLSQVCPAIPFHPVEIEANTTYSFGMSGNKSNCFFTARIKDGRPKGTYRFIHNEAYRFSINREEESFSVSGKSTIRFVVR